MDSASPERGTEELARALEPGLVLLGPHGELRFASPAARLLLEAPGDAAVTERLGALTAGLTDPGHGAAEAGIVVEVPVESGGRRVLVSAWPLPASGPEDRAGMALLLRDADQLAGLGEALRLAAHMRAVAAITPAMGHDLRGPINSMVFNLEVLKETLGGGALAANAAAPERRDRYLRVLRDELSRLHHGLEIWLAQTAERTQEVEDCDLRELLGELAALLVPPGRKRQVQIAWHPPEEAANVAARRSALKQALLLFGLAALEAAPRGTSLALGLAGGDGRISATINSGSSQGLRTARFPLQLIAEATPAGLHFAALHVEESGGRVRVSGEPDRPVGFELQWPAQGH